MRTLIRDDQFWEQLNDSDKGMPLLLTGTFNSPSHLDWVPEARHLHCDRVFPWPTTQLLQNNGLIDSYRQVRNYFQ